MHHFSDTCNTMRCITIVFFHAHDKLSVWTFRFCFGFFFFWVLGKKERNVWTFPPLPPYCYICILNEDLGLWTVIHYLVLELHQKAQNLLIFICEYLLFTFVHIIQTISKKQMKLWLQVKVMNCFLYFWRVCVLMCVWGQRIWRPRLTLC